MGFVKIINGEVVTDPNDPRVRNLQQASSTSSMYPSSASSSSSRSGARGGASSFGSIGTQGPGASRQAAPGANNGNLFGMPEFTLFDVTMKPQQYLIAILLCMFGGPVGLAFVLIMFFVYRYYIKSVRGAPVRGEGIRATFDGFLESIFGGGIGGGAPPAGGQAPGRAPGGGNNRPGGGFGRL